MCQLSPSSSAFSLSLHPFPASLPSSLSLTLFRSVPVSFLSLGGLAIKMQGCKKEGAMLVELLLPEYDYSLTVTSHHSKTQTLSSQEKVCASLPSLQQEWSGRYKKWADTSFQYIYSTQYIISFRGWLKLKETERKKETKKNRKWCQFSNIQDWFGLFD